VQPADLPHRRRSLHSRTRIPHAAVCRTVKLHKGLLESHQLTGGHHGPDDDERSIADEQLTPAARRCPPHGPSPNR